jgi:hypothetical protein
MYNKSMGLARFPINDYRGGWNIRDNPAELQANETPYTSDFTLTPVGQLKQRRGTTPWSRAALGAGSPIYNMRRWVVGSGATIEMVMASVEGDVFSIPVGTQEATSRFAGPNETIWTFEPSRDRSGRDYLWMVNGTSAPQRWDGIEAATRAWAGTVPARECTLLKSWKNIMFASGNPAAPYRLYWSSIGDPETGLTTNFIDIGTVDDDQDPIMDLAVLGDNLVVLKRNSIWAVYDPITMNNRRLGTPGCEGRFQTAEVNNRLYYFSRYGIFSVGPSGDINNESDQIRAVFTGENNPLDSLNTSRMDKPRVFGTYADRILTAVPVNGETENNRVYEIIPQINARRTSGRRYATDSSIMRHRLGLSSMVSILPNATFVGTTRGNKFIYRLFSGTQDEHLEGREQVILPRWISAFRGIQEEEPIERVRRVNIEFSGSMIADVYKEFEMEVPIFSRRVDPLNPQLDPLWEGGEWEGGEWGSGPVVSLGRIRPESRARYHAIGFRGVDEEASKPGVSVFAAEVVYRGGKEH